MLRRRERAVTKSMVDLELARLETALAIEAAEDAVGNIDSFDGSEVDNVDSKET